MNNWLKRGSYLTTLCAVVIVLSSVAGFIQLPDYIYYMAVGVFGISSVIGSKGFVMGNTLPLFILIISLLSLLVNNPPAYFNAYSRLSVYSLIVFVIGPIFVSKKMALNRVALLETITLFYVILSALSFFCYFLGINFFTRLGDTLDIGAGTFSGLFNHSMALGPAAAISVIYLFSILVENKRNKNLVLIALLLCAGSLLLAASRAAIGATVVGVITVLIRYYRGRLQKAVLVVFVLIGIAAATFPIWGGLTDFVMQKQQNNIDLGGSFYFSREAKSLARITEFKENPIIGIGYCIIDPALDWVNTETGQIEPGSSWLAIMSMTGCVGLILFVSLFISAFKKTIQSSHYLSPCFCGLLSFFVVHMLVEGYIFAPRSFLSFYLWLLLACVFGTNKYLSNANTNN